MKRAYEDYLRDMLENAEVIWRTVQDDLPVIIPALQKMIAKRGNTAVG